MLITDLSHIELTSQAQNIQGGGGKKNRKNDIFAFADANSDAYAVGKNFASTETTTFTKTSTTGYAASYSSGSSSSVSN